MSCFLQKAEGRGRLGKIRVNKLASKDAVMRQFRDGQSIMVGGFNKVGVPGTLVRWLEESGVKDITLIVNNCSNAEGSIWSPAAKMIKDGRVSHLKISYIATNSDVCALYEAHVLDIEIIPQGTLAERIRAGGCGIGGFLTTVGVGTMIAEGKQEITINGIKYVLEMPLAADLALVKASLADPMGNGLCFGTSKNFNPAMASAASYVMLETDRLVPVGEIGYEHVDVAGIYVDMVIPSAEEKA